MTDSIIQDPVQQAEVLEKWVSLAKAVAQGDIQQFNTLFSMPGYTDVAANNNNFILKLAASKGYLPIVIRLLEIPEIEKQITVEDNAVFFSASRNNQVDVVNYLLNFQAVRETLVSKNRIELLDAVENKRTEILNLILSIPGVQEQANFSNNKLLQEAVLRGYVDIVERLLKIESVASDAAINNNEILLFAILAADEPIVELLLQQPMVIGSITADGNLAFRTAEARLDNDPNGVYRRIVDRLSAIPAVLEYEQNNTNDLEAENSMRPLNDKQQGILETLKEHYKTQFEEKSQAGILAEIKQFIEIEYAKEPALDPQGNPLPLQYVPGYDEETLKCYYRHAVHSTYRFLSIPNPWIHPEANFVNELPDGSKSANISPDDMELLCYLWLAANDKKVIPENGHTHQDMPLYFIKELAPLARAHNWDKERLNAVTQLLEFYDDLQADKPSCRLGMTQRLMLCVPGSPYLNLPENRYLDVNTLRERFKLHFVTQQTAESDNIYDRLMKLPADKLANLYEEYNHFFIEAELILSEDSQRLFQLQEASLKAFIEDCYQWFTKERITQQQPKPLKYAMKQMSSYQEVFEYLANDIPNVFAIEIWDKLQQLQASPKLASSCLSPEPTLLFSGSSSKDVKVKEKKARSSEEPRLKKRRIA